MYIKLTNGVPASYTLGQLRRDNPNTSFPKIIPDSILVEFGVFPVSIDEKPAPDERVKNVTRDALPTFENGAWVSKWTVSDKTADEIAEYADLKAAQNREVRSVLLAGTDWWAVQDRTMSPAEIGYRQALRDITAHPSWPHLSDLDWPVPPA